MGVSYTQVEIEHGFFGGLGKPNPRLEYQRPVSQSGTDNAFECTGVLRCIENALIHAS
jgi:hypothetical protein